VNPIRRAIKEGDFEKLRALVSYSPVPLEELLLMAVQDYNTAPKHQGHEQIIDFLIRQGATPHWWTLFEPARAGSQEIVDRLLAGGAEYNIFTCATIGDLTRTRKLLQRQPALVQARTSNEVRAYCDFTPLHFCCLSALGRRRPAKETELLNTAKLLVDHGADINANATFYGTLTVMPLDMAAHTGGNIRLVEFLIGQGATISSFAFGEALAHRGRSLREGLTLAELFLRHGFRIDTAYKDGTVLQNAANTGKAEVVEWLLAHGADVKARGRLGRTPLHLAAERNRSSRTAEILVQWGADMNAKDDQGLTALDVAEHHGKTAVARWLRRALAKTSTA
jgi:ankyrin repeat protein